MVTWYYKRKISENEEKLSTMQFEKKKILDEVTETETYKKAKEILLKFAPDQLKMTPLSPQSSYRVPQPTETPRRSVSPQNLTSPSNLGELRKRVLTSQMPVVNVSRATPINSGLAPVGISPIPSTPIGFQSGISPVIPAMGYRSPLPRPILPRERNYLERLVDYIVGDGPANRYALICRQCFSHNGMSLKEEFEYFGFKCCYCNTWNPARKQKCDAQRLEHDATLSSMQLNTSNETEEQALSSPSNDNEANAKPLQNEPSSPSDTDSDIELVERPTESEDTEKIADESKKEDVADELNDGVEKMDIDESAS